MTTVHFLVEGAAGAGLGHVRRSLVLAAALTEAGAECTFAIEAGRAAHLVSSTGYRVEPWPMSSRDLPVCDVVIGDSYNISASDGAAWRARARLRVVIDDMADRKLDADIVVNHNLYALGLDYGVLTGAVVLAGPRYSLIAPEFVALSSGLPNEERALMSFGGTDDGRWSAPVAEAILRRGGWSIEVAVVGAVNAGLAALRDESGGHISVHVSAGMAALMSRCSAFVGSAAIGALEAVAARRPAVVCSIASSQALNVAALREVGIVAFGEFDPQAMAEALAAKPAKPRAGVIDGEGPRRLVQEILSRLR